MRCEKFLFCKDLIKNSMAELCACSFQDPTKKKHGRILFFCDPAKKPFAGSYSSKILPKIIGRSCSC